MEEDSWQLQRAYFPDIAQAVRCGNLGGEQISSDAIESDENPKSGWGARKNTVLMKGRWQKNSRVALKEGIMSISPLELLSAARMIIAIEENNMIPKWTRTVAVSIVNTIAFAYVKDGLELSCKELYACSYMFSNHFAYMWLCSTQRPSAIQLSNFLDAVNEGKRKRRKEIKDPWCGRRVK